MKRTGAIIACFLALNSALAACAPKTIPDDDTSPRTNAVIGLSKGTISGPCAIGIGPSGSRKIATIVEFATAWPADTQTAAYRSVRLGPGEWDLYQIQCGQFAIDRPAGPRGFTPARAPFGLWRPSRSALNRRSIWAMSNSRAQATTAGRSSESASTPKAPASTWPARTQPATAR